MGKTYRSVADEIEQDILSGRLSVGQQLPPQRDFAYEQGLAPSTVGRVYQELVRRNLVIGEVGRGTYVRDVSQYDRTLLEVPSEPMDLAINYPIIEDQSRIMAPALRRLSRPDLLEKALKVGPTDGAELKNARRKALEYLGLDGDRGLIFTSGGRQAIGCAIDALVPQGGAFGVEEWTYPIVLKLARRLGRTPIPIAMDDKGVIPHAVFEAYQRKPFATLYVQPTIHNPTTVTMPLERRRELLDVTSKLGITAIEDRAYTFLSNETLPCLVDLKPDTVSIDSFTKRGAPGLSLGVITALPNRLPLLTQVALEMGWIAQTFAIHAVIGWIIDGALLEIEAAKRTDAAERQRTFMRAFTTSDTLVRCAGYHAWVQPQGDLRSQAVLEHLQNKGIAVTAANAYCSSAALPYEAVRVALSRVDLADLTKIAPLIQRTADFRLNSVEVSAD